jgi:hypothetical protein
MVGLCSDQVIAIVKNVEMNFCLLKTEDELLTVDTNSDNIRFATQVTWFGSSCIGSRIRNGCSRNGSQQFASHSPTTITPANKPGALIRLLLVQDQTRAFAYVQQAEDAGKLTADQATAIDNFWVAHHKQFACNFVLRRLLRAQNESNVKAYLDKAVANNKITVDQEKT